MPLVHAIKGEIDARVKELDPVQLRTWNDWILLSEDGHAVLLDWTDGADGKVERLTLHHYLSCGVCVARKAKRQQT